jgi:hypothetical protein
MTQEQLQEQMEQIVLSISPALKDIANRDGGINPLSKRMADKLFKVAQTHAIEEQLKGLDLLLGKIEGMEQNSPLIIKQEIKALQKQLQEEQA